mgnify:CR=1 FL=1
MNEEDEAFEDLAKRQEDWGMQGSRKHQILRYAENVESKGTSTTQEEIDIMWQQAMRESIKNNEMYTRYHFAILVAEKERTWIGLEGAEAGWFCYTDFLNARKYTKKQRQLICCQLLSEAQSWDIGNYQLMMHDSTKIKENT